MKNNLQLPDIEKVSARQHKKWVSDKEGQGHKSVDVNGENLMVPFEDLSEDAKQACRNRTNMFYESVNEIHAEENTQEEATQQEEHAHANAQQ